MDRGLIRIAIHGGAGVMDPGKADSDQARARLSVLRAVVEEAWGHLHGGGSALDAVELAVVRLEDCEHFNAGRGSVLTAAGTVEMDAAIMDGRDRRAGAVAAARAVRNPVAAARRLMDATQYVMLAGEAADAFARREGLPCEEPAYFVTPARRVQLEKARAARRIALDLDEQLGTVGAVARDARGDLAAATSTGGMTNQMPGRIGDTPVIGAGVWADNATCAVSSTGDGERILRAVLAADIHGRMRYGAQALSDAAAGALETVGALGGQGGCIAVGREGELVLAFNSPGMYRAWAAADGAVRTGILDE